MACSKSARVNHHRLLCLRKDFMFCKELSLPEVSQIKKIKNKDDLCVVYHTTDLIDFGRLDIILRSERFL